MRAERLEYLPVEASAQAGVCFNTALAWAFTAHYGHKATMNRSAFALLAQLEGQPRTVTWAGGGGL